MHMYSSFFFGSRIENSEKKNNISYPFSYLREKYQGQIQIPNFFTYIKVHNSYMITQVEKNNLHACFAQILIFWSTGPIQEQQKNDAKMTYLWEERKDVNDCKLKHWAHLSTSIWSYLSHECIINSIQSLGLCAFEFSIALLTYLARYRAPDSIS